jgi:hypothetical protein
MKRLIFIILLALGNSAHAALQTATIQDKPARICLKSHQVEDNGTVSSFGIKYEFTGHSSSADGLSGSAWWMVHSATDPTANSCFKYGDAFATWSWDPNSSFATWINSATIVECNGTNYEYFDAPDAWIPVYREHCDVNVSFPSGARENRGAKARISLQTGGRSTSKDRNLFSLFGSARVTYPNIYWADSGGTSWVYLFDYGTNIPATNITIAQTSLDSTGTMFTTLQDDREIDVTPTATGYDAYVFNVGQQRYDIKITANNIDVSTALPEFCVGQQVAMSASWVPALPASVSQDCSWVLSLPFLNDYHLPAAAGGSSIPLINQEKLDTNAASLWWYGDGYKYNYCHLRNIFPNSQVFSFVKSCDVKVFTPTVRFPASPIQPMNVLVKDGLLECGDSDGKGAPSFSATIYSVTNFSGVANWVQLIKRGGSPQYRTTAGEFWLDNDPFYNTSGGGGADGTGGTNVNTRISPFGSIFFDDHPNGTVSHYPLSARSLDDKFLTYLVFKPDGASDIWVTLGLVKWEWSGTESTSALGVETLTSSWTNGPSFLKTNSFPNWNSVLHNQN